MCTRPNVVRSNGTRLLLAHPERAAIEMQMVAVRRVVVGPENRVEVAACAAMEVVQELRFIVLARPVGLNADAAAVAQREPRDVKRVGVS